MPSEKPKTWFFSAKNSRIIWDVIDGEPVVICIKRLDDPDQHVMREEDINAWNAEGYDGKGKYINPFDVCFAPLAKETPAVAKSLWSIALNFAAPKELVKSV